MATTYLTRTPSSTSNRKTWTFSAWVKRSAIPDAAGNYLFQQSQAEGNYMKLYFFANKIYWRGQTSSSNTAYKVTNRLFRDTSAWYHVVARFDSTQNTAGDRMRLYINGVQETSFSTDIDPALNHDSFCNTTNPMDIGRDNVNNGSYFDGYMSHVAFVDGQSLAPTVFGETDSTSGTWKFKSPTGVTWGTNGFHLKFENSGALGTDSSGLTNTFTVNGNLKQALDTPSNSSAVMSTPTWYDGSITNGGNTVTTNQTSYRYQTSSLGVSKGKWYWEAKLSTADNYALMGITDAPAPVDANTTWILGSGAYDYSVLYNTVGGNGHKYNNAGTNPTNTPGAFMGAFAQGDIITFALDCDNNTLKIGANGNWSNGTGSTNQTFSNTTAISITDPVSTNTGFYFPAIGDYGGNVSVFDLNFGNGLFGTTAITSAGSNGNGSLFEYDVPSGYYALNTKNINTYG